MSKRRKSQSYNPAIAVDKRYRVQRSDGIILAADLDLQDAREVAEQLRGKNTSGLSYLVMPEGRPVVDLRDYLKQ